MACTHEFGPRPLHLGLHDPRAQLVIHNVCIVCIDREVHVRRFTEIFERLVEPAGRNTHQLSRTKVRMYRWLYHDIDSDSDSEQGMT